MRSPHTIGEELPEPESFVCQSRFLPLRSQEMGSDFSVAAPWPLGPRKRGQFRSAPALGMTRATTDVALVMPSATSVVAGLALRRRVPAVSALAPLSNGGICL